MNEGRDILIVEDDRAIAAGLELNLRLAGHRTTAAYDGDEAVACMQTGAFDLVLLDINLPRRNGLEILQSRLLENPVPVIVLSARDGETDKVAALRLGADDYVTKPFALAELLARIDAVLRRTQAKPAGARTPADQPLLRFADVVIDPIARALTRAGVEIKLTHREFELLLFFVRNPSRVFDRNRVFAAVWGQAAGSSRTVDNFVGQLRRHFEKDPERPRHFVTVRGAGYRFEP